MKWHGARGMLNGPGYQSTAAFAFEIQDTERKDQIPSYTFQLSNCDRSISFELDSFSYYGRTKADRDAAYRNDLDKINKLIEGLEAFREGLIIERARFVRRRR